VPIVLLHVLGLLEVLRVLLVLLVLLVLVLLVLLRVLRVLWVPIRRHHHRGPGGRMVGVNATVVVTRKVHDRRRIYFGHIDSLLGPWLVHRNLRGSAGFTVRSRVHGGSV